METVWGPPPSYINEMKGLNLPSKKAFENLCSGFSMATGSCVDHQTGLRVFTVHTPYGEDLRMSLIGDDVPRRTSNMCPIVQNSKLMSKESPTQSELLGQFFFDPTRVKEYAKRHNIEPYDYKRDALDDMNLLPGGYLDEKSARVSEFDRVAPTTTSVFSYDIPTPRPRHGDSVILIGDLAEIWGWSKMAEMPLQDSLDKVFCDILGTKHKGTFDECLDGPRKRIRDSPIFYVTDVTRGGLDFTELTRQTVLTMSSIPCLLSDAYLRQVNDVYTNIYPIKEDPVAPGSLFHAVSEDYQNGRGKGQAAELMMMAKDPTGDCNRLMKLTRESSTRVPRVMYYRCLVCEKCSRDCTHASSIADETSDKVISHCGVPVHNMSRFVTVQPKALRRTYSLDCCRKVHTKRDEMPMYNKSNDRIGIFTEDQVKHIYERPCAISDFLRPAVYKDIGNQRAKYDNISCTIYILVPFSREATLDRMETIGIEHPSSDQLIIHNVVQCILPICSREGLKEYRFEAVVVRCKLTISVQAYGKTQTGDVPLFDPESTTKRLSVEMLGEDGKRRLHQYRHQLEYNQQRYVQTNGPLLTVANFKQYPSKGTINEKPIHERTNWDTYGYTMIGSLAANFVRCAYYRDQPLVSPEHLRFGIVSDTRTQREKLAKPQNDKKRKLHGTCETMEETEMKLEMERLQNALEEEHQRSSKLSDDLVMANLTLQLNEWSNKEDKKQIEKLVKKNEQATREYLALRDATNEKIDELQTRLESCQAELHEAKRAKNDADSSPDHSSYDFCFSLSPWTSTLVAV